MSNHAPKVSVIIPTVNRKKWVCEAIESVLSQTYKDYEILVIDDGSSDGTFEELFLRYGKKIKLYRSTGTNAPTAKNLGVSHASGEYIAILDDDDLWYPNKLDLQIKLLESSDETVGMVGGGCDYIDANGRPFWKPSIPDAEVTYEMACIKVHMPGSGSNELIRKSIFDEIGGFDCTLTRGEDRDFWIKISRNYRIKMVQEVLCSIRVHSTERKGVNFDVIKNCRFLINKRIPENNIRRKADAWLYFYLFKLVWPVRKRDAIRYILFSFIKYPFPLNVSTNRFKSTVKLMLKLD